MSANAGRIYTWAIQRTESHLAPLWVGVLFCFELILFIPLDAILMFFCLQNRKRIWLYVGIAALASTISALCGYLLGHLLWDLIKSYIIPYLLSSATFENWALHFEAHETLAIFCGALLPFPLKALSLAAGIFHLTLAPFLTFVALARLVRFSLIGGAMQLWGGDKVKFFVENNFQRILLVIGAKVAIGFSLFWAISN